MHIMLNIWIILIISVIIFICSNIYYKKIEGYGSTKNTNYGFIHPFYLYQTIDDELDSNEQQIQKSLYGYIESPYYVEFGAGSPYLKHSKPAPYLTNNTLYDFNKLPKYNFYKDTKFTIKQRLFYPHAYIR